MTVLTPSRPDLAAHREATATAFPKLVRDLTGIIGRKLTAYIAGVKDVRALDRWIERAEPYKNAEGTPSRHRPTSPGRIRRRS